MERWNASGSWSGAFFGLLGIIGEFSRILARFRVINSSNCLAESCWNPIERESARMREKTRIASRETADPSFAQDDTVARSTVPPLHRCTVPPLSATLAAYHQPKRFKLSRQL